MVTRRVGTHRKVCRKCHRSFSSSYPQAVFCSARCRQATHTVKASSTKRGYDNEHRLTRERLLPLAYGRRCPLCHKVMLRRQALDLDHSTPLHMGGRGAGDRIVHSSCNRSKGASEGNRKRDAPSISAIRRSIDW